jgi:hypothetical protein
MDAALRTVLSTLGPLGGLLGGAIGFRSTLWAAAVGFALTLTPSCCPRSGLRELPPAPAGPAPAAAG